MRARRPLFRLLASGVLTASFCATAAQYGVAQAVATLETASPEEVGLSSLVLERIGPAMQDLLDAERTGGVLTLVARRGEVVHWESHGWRVPGADPLEPTDLFRIYSMTKPVTSVAAMILVEEGTLSLDDEVSRFIPGFADVQVYDNGVLRPPARPMLVRHLLSHTSGLTYGIFGDSPVDSLYLQEFDLLDLYNGNNLTEVVNRVAALPLLDDPGDRWNYSVSTDVLGRVIEVVSGQSLDGFFHDRIFEPLGMTETGFQLPAGQTDRLVAMVASTGDGLRVLSSPSDPEVAGAPSWFSGGAGLVSSAADYLRFSTMLLRGGELDGVRILSTELVDSMRRNHLPPDLVPIPMPWSETGFGLGFAVSMAEHAGTYFWLGAANTYFWIDPEEDLIVFAWTQLQPPLGMPLDAVLRPIVYDAILRP